MADLIEKAVNALIGSPGDGPGLFALKTPDYVQDLKLVASTSQQTTVPTGYKYALFSAEADFSAAYGASPTATIEATSTTNGSGSEKNPSLRYVGDVAKIAVISATAGNLTIAYYK